MACLGVYQVLNLTEGHHPLNSLLWVSILEDSKLSGVLGCWVIWINGELQLNPLSLARIRPIHLFQLFHLGSKGMGGFSLTERRKSSGGFGKLTHGHCLDWNFSIDVWSQCSLLKEQSQFMIVIYFRLFLELDLFSCIPIDQNNFLGHKKYGTYFPLMIKYYPSLIFLFKYVFVLSKFVAGMKRTVKPLLSMNKCVNTWNILILSALYLFVLTVKDVSDTGTQIHL
jgi:hypothetical protein